MRRLPLAALAALVLAAPAAAQKEESANTVISVRYAVPPRAVYVAAFNAFEARGVPLRARMLDQALLTLPQFSTDNPKQSETATVMLLEIEEKGDSTHLTIQAQMVHPDGRPAQGVEGSVAQVLTAEIDISAAIASLLDSLPPGSGGPDPRELSDEYGYGRRNPIHVGGGSESGAANQRAYLDGLRGPAGQPVTYRRLGSCCSFRSRHAPQGGALDAYEVTFEGIERPVLLYLDLYTPPEGALPAPAGFTLAANASPS